MVPWKSRTGPGREQIKRSPDVYSNLMLAARTYGVNAVSGVANRL
jgi:hypothetical protein